LIHDELPRQSSDRDIVSAARSFGATISTSGFCRMNVSTCATCLLLSCCASLITNFTSGIAANSFSISAFCAAR
jgi:hypothetical protein